MMIYRSQQYTTNNSTSEEDKESVQLLHEAIKAMKELSCIDIAEKNFYHYVGLQGFKRLHRYAAREDYECVMALESLLIDHYGIEPGYIESEYVPCEKRGIVERMEYYAKVLEEKLGKMNYVKTELVKNDHHFAAGYIQEIICDLEDNLKYAYRRINFAKDVGGSIKDLHWYSHEVHEDYKCKEKDDHNRVFI